MVVLNASFLQLAQVLQNASVLGEKKIINSLYLKTLPSNS